MSGCLRGMCEMRVSGVLSDGLNDGNGCFVLNCGGNSGYMGVGCRLLKCRGSTVAMKYELICDAWGGGLVGCRVVVLTWGAILNVDLGASVDSGVIWRGVVWSHREWTASAGCTCSGCRSVADRLHAVVTRALPVLDRRCAWLGGFEDVRSTIRWQPCRVNITNTSHIVGLPGTNTHFPCSLSPVSNPSPTRP